MNDIFNQIELLEHVDIRIHSEWERGYSTGERRVYVMIRFDHDSRKIEVSKYWPKGTSAGTALREAWEEFTRMLYASVPKSDYTPALLTQDVF